MRLLEVVRGARTDPEAVARITAFADRALGKSVIACKDTPGFIANRIGCYWMQAAFKAAFEMGLPIEEADAVMGRPLGIPKTGVFGLARSRRHRPVAACGHEPAQRAAAGRCVPRRRSRLAADRRR